MVSVLQISSVNINNRQNLYTKNNIISYAHPQLNTEQNNLLMNFMQLMGRNNAFRVSFGDKTEHLAVGWAYKKSTGELNSVYTPQGHYSWLEEQNRNAIQAEASKRITGSYDWPKIDKVNAWMVTAETKKFMQAGGLGTVANDLPDSFNKVFSANGETMSVITPLYTNSKYMKIINPVGGKLKYQFKEGKAIDIEKIATIKVPIYKVDNWDLNGNPQGGLTENRNVNVYRAMVGDDENKPKTPYIFIEDNEVFNIDSAKGDCYAENKFNYGENLRFAYFSRCVYELAKHLKNQENEGVENGTNIKAPNVMIMNDWHVGPLAPLMKYMSIAEAEKNKISEQTAQYFKETPSIYIAHNLTYQGDMYENKQTLRTNVLGTLFEEHAKTIVENAHNRDDLPPEDRNSLFKEFALNPGMMGIALADRIAPVSLNYGEELLASPTLGRGLQNILKIRNYYGTFAPITNGLTKSTVIPSSENINSWMNSVKSDLAVARTKDNQVNLEGIELQPYATLSVKDGKAENKKQIFELLKRIIDRERKEDYKDYKSLDTLVTDKKYVMYKPWETSLDDIEDITKVPVMTFVGRVADQKGIDSIFKKAYLDFAREFKNNPRYKDWEVPIVIVGGPTEEVETYKKLESFKNELRNIDERFANRFILFKGFANTNLLSLGSDFFLIPSNFEPCGLVQMEVMPKGVLPIATSTGGLVSTITDQKDGFLSTAFYDGKDNYYNNSGKVMYVGTQSRDIPETNWKGYEDAMVRALHTFFKLPNKLEKMQRTAMEKDFSWTTSNGPLEKYMKLMKEGKFEDRQPTFFDMPDETDTKEYTI